MGDLPKADRKPSLSARRRKGNGGAGSKVTRYEAGSPGQDCPGRAQSDRKRACRERTSSDEEQPGKEPCDGGPDGKWDVQGTGPAYDDSHDEGSG